jgi:long-chain acyl-CoA synthetase
VVKARPAYATPKLVWWTLQPWSIEAGLITPTPRNERRRWSADSPAEIDETYAKRPGWKRRRGPVAAIERSTLGLLSVG